MLTNNGITASGIRFLGGGAASTFVDSRNRVGWSMANRAAFSKTTSFPVGYYENALKRPLSVGEIGSTFRTFGAATTSSSLFGRSSVAATLNLTGLITTTGFLIRGVVKSGSAAGIATFEPLTLAGRGVIAATLNIGFKPSAFDIAQEVWGAIASLNNVIGTMGEVLNSATGGGGGGASASSIATAVWDRLLSGHTTTGSAGKALADAGGGSSPSIIASAVRSELTTELGRIDATVSSRLASAGYTAPDNATISTINTKLGTPTTSVSADIATRASQTSVNAIPTTTLLSTDLRLDNLDATVSSRLPTSTYTAPISAATIATQVRTELGVELGRIDTTISSRNATTPPTAVQIRTELDTNSTKLDVAVSTRLAGVSYTIPPTASQVATQVRTELTTELGRLDTAISTRLSSAGYTSPDNTTIGTINTKIGTPSISVSADIATRASQTTLDAIPTTTLLSNDSRLNNLDATISSRLATVGYSAPVSAATLASQVRTELSVELARIDVATSSRLASVSYTIPPTVTAIRSEIDTNSTKLDVAVSTRLASGTYSTPPTALVIAGQVRTELNTELTKIVAIPANPLLTTDSRLNNLDATVSSRLASNSYTAPIAASVVASQVRTELSTELGRIDVATSTRLASANYTAPNNSGIASILEDTNELQNNQNQWITATGFATPTNVSNAQTAIISEINANETKLDSIKAKTDILVNTDLSGVEAGLVVINEGVKKASLLVPHSEDL